jgi:glycerol-3-phosphate O-acyltransferase / dihydroxyacetone phosphate acyltransferase
MLYHSLRAAAHVALRWYYADVVVQGAERVPERGPLLVVANHPNALVDALLVSTALRRRIMLTAKATLFEHPLLAPLLRTIGVVPLRRAADERAAATQSSDGTIAVARNVDAFQQVRATLAAGRAVLVFPEGISHDAPALAPLRTGAARMALDAATQGVRGLQLLPLGLVFECKERPRSRVLVRAGTPIDLDLWLAAHGDGSAAALTTELDAALRTVTLNFASDARAERAVTLARALAAIADTPPNLAHPRPLATEAAIAMRIERATDAVAEASPALAAEADGFIARVFDLERRLARAGATLADIQISPRLRHGAWFVVREASLAALALPVALLGRVTHWLPLRLARSLAMRSLASDPSRDQPAMRTILLGLGMVLLWYAAQFALAARLFGALPAALWLVAIALAARIDFQLGDRLQRARERARTYLALRRDPGLRDRALAEMETLLADAVSLEGALLPAGG